MLPLDRPKEAMSQIIHRAGVVYIKERGEGIGGGGLTATEDSLWKMPRLSNRDGDVTRVEHAFPHSVSSAECVRVSVCLKHSVCVCMFLMGAIWTHTHTCIHTFHMLHHLQAVLVSASGMWLLEWFSHVYGVNYTTSPCSWVVYLVQVWWTPIYWLIKQWVRST